MTDVDELVAAAGSRLAKRPVAVPELDRLLARGRRGTSARAALFVLAAVLAAVGVMQLRSGDDNGDVVEVAAGAMADVTSFRMEMTFEGRSGVADAEPIVLKQEATYADGDYQGVLGLGGFRVETRVIDGVAYQQPAPEVREEAGLETPWVAAPVPDRAGSLRDGLLVETPTDQLRQLLGVDATPDAVGTDNVRGTATTRYRLALTGEQARRYRARTSGEPPPGDQVRVEVEIWIDDDDLMRRHRLRITTRSPGQDEVSTAMTTVEVFDIGLDVPPIERPPANQVTFFDTIDALQAKLSSGSSVAPRLELSPTVRTRFCPAHDALSQAVANLSPTPRARDALDTAIQHLTAAIEAADGQESADVAARSQLRSIMNRTRMLRASMEINARPSMESAAANISELLEALAHNCN